MEIIKLSSYTLKDMNKANEACLPEYEVILIRKNLMGEQLCLNLYFLEVFLCSI